MLKIKSLNAASYISHETGVVGEVIKLNGRTNAYSFPLDKDVIDSYNRYRKAVSEQSELTVNLIKYNRFIRDYKYATHRKKSK